MKDKKQTTLYLCLCLTCLANYNPVVAKTPVNMGILPTYVHSNKIESAPSLQDKKEGTIVGKITDKSGEPIVGATIKVKGSSVGTVSDVQGNYRTIECCSSVFFYGLHLERAKRERQKHH